jgi:hypothetical protein
MSWLSEAMTDETGQGDIAYGAIGALTGAAIGALIFIAVMSAISYFRCIPLVKPDVVVNCTFDPLPMGQAAGLVFAAFATLIGSLAGYMVATRKQRPPQAPPPPVTSTVTTTATTVQPAPAEAATDLGPPTIQKVRKGKR